MHPALSRLSLLCLTAMLGPACVISPSVPDNPCEPNPCTQADKNTCVNDNGKALCLCREGTVPRPSGACEPVSSANCPEHAGDGAEPDDCLARALPVTSSTTPRQQSIEPVGDYDFFRIDATARDIHAVTVQPGQGAALLPRVDIFDQAGQWLTAQDGNPQAQVGFKARVTGPYYVRVSHSPVDPSSATGLYSLTLSAPVRDDHGDNSDEAASITPSSGGGTTPTPTYGRLEYGQDEDWFTFTTNSANPQALYRVEFRSGYSVPAIAIFTKENVKDPLLTAQGSYVEFRADTTRYYIAIYSAKGVPGSYAFNVFEYR